MGILSNASEISEVVRPKRLAGLESNVLFDTVLACSILRAILRRNAVKFDTAFLWVSTLNSFKFYSIHGCFSIKSSMVLFRSISRLSLTLSGVLALLNGEIEVSGDITSRFDFACLDSCIDSEFAKQLLVPGPVPKAMEVFKHAHRKRLPETPRAVNESGFVFFAK